jgi:hypothetical protein
MSASKPLGNYGRHPNTLESSGYVFTPFGMGDVFGSPAPFNFREEKKSELLTAQGIPALATPDVAQDEQVARAETQTHVKPQSQNTTLILVGAAVVVAAFMFGNDR